MPWGHGRLVSASRSRSITAAGRLDVALILILIGGMTAYLTSRVDYFRREFLAATFDDVTEGIFNSGIIALHEMAFDESHRQG